MKNLINIFLVNLILITGIFAQQIPYMSDFAQTRHQWNPAATAIDNHMIYNLHYRQQWLGFEQAPRLATFGFQYPFVDYNMAIGAIVSSDKAGALANNSITLNYAYQLKELLFDDDKLAFGLSGNYSQFRLNSEGQVYPDEDDPLINNEVNSTLLPNVSGGFYYDSGSDQEYGNNQLFFGFALNYGIPMDLSLGGGNLQRQAHYSFMLGNKLWLDDSYLEASFLANTTRPELVYLAMNLKYEIPEMMWFGAGYAINNTFSIHGGYIFKEGILGDGFLRTGVMASYSLDNDARYFGLNYEVYVAYEFEIRR